MLKEPKGAKGDGGKWQIFIGQLTPSHVTKNFNFNSIKVCINIDKELIEKGM